MEPMANSLPKAINTEPTSGPKNTQKTSSFEDRQAQYKAEDIWKSAGIPERHRPLVAHRAEQDGPWGDAYKRLAEALPTLLVLLGPRGTGKTQLAVCLAANVALEGRSVKYCKAMDLFREIRACYQPGGPDEVRTVAGFCRKGCLIFDEAQERSDSQWENLTFGNIIDKRYDACLPTILISNYSKDAFADAVGASIVSRIHECGEVVECNWPSFRKPR